MGGTSARQSADRGLFFLFYYFCPRYCEHFFFCEMCNGAFFSLHAEAAWFHSFFPTRDFQRPALSEVNRATLCRWKKGREPELRVVHSRDVELMANVVRKRNLRVFA